LALKNFDLMWAELFPAEQARIIQLVIDIIEVHPDKIIITFHPSGMLSVLQQFIPDLKAHGDVDETMVMEIPVLFQRRNRRKKISMPDGRSFIDMSNENINDALVKAIARAHQWQEMIDNGDAKSIKQIAVQENLPPSYAQKMMRLLELAPDITSAIVNGTQPEDLQLKDLVKVGPLPLDWNEQRKMLGF
jgi:hypothetical protein